MNRSKHEGSNIVLALIIMTAVMMAITVLPAVIGVIIGYIAGKMRGPKKPWPLDHDDSDMEITLGLAFVSFALSAIADYYLIFYLGERFGTGLSLNGKGEIMAAVFTGFVSFAACMLMQGKDMDKDQSLPPW